MYNTPGETTAAISTLFSKLKGPKLKGPFNNQGFPQEPLFSVRLRMEGKENP